MFIIWTLHVVVQNVMFSSHNGLTLKQCLCHHRKLKWYTSKETRKSGYIWHNNKQDGDGKWHSCSCNRLNRLNRNTPCCHSDGHSEHASWHQQRHTSKGVVQPTRLRQRASHRSAVLACKSSWWWSASRLDEKVHRQGILRLNNWVISEAVADIV